MKMKFVNGGFYKSELTLAVLLAFGPALFMACPNPETESPAQATLITWEARQLDGAAGTRDSASILFHFSADPGPLNAADITISGARSGALSGTGRTRTLALTMVTDESANVNINKAGIAPRGRIVTLCRQADIAWLVEASGHDSAGAVDLSEISTGGKSTSRFEFTFTEPVENLEENEINLGINGWCNIGLTPNTDKTIWTLEGEIVRDIHTNQWQNLNARITHTGVRSVTNTPEPKYYEAVCTYWSAAQQGGISGSQPSESIDITFDFPLSKPLEREEVTITNGTGMAAKGDVTRIDNDDKKWRIALAAVEASGTVTVTILKAGVMRRGYFGGSEIPRNMVSVISTTAANDFAVEQVGGTSGTVSTTAIKLTFDRAVENLAASDITITSSGGNAALRSGAALTFSADKKVWTVQVSVAVEGQIKVKIPSKPGVSTAEKTVTVYKKPGIKTNESGNPDLDYYLAGLASNNAASPATVRLHSSVSIAGDWGLVHSTVNTAAKYIILDLSACLDTSITGGSSPSGNNFNIIYNNPYIKGIILPAGLTEIGDYAFKSCNNITRVGTTANTLRIPAGVTRIGVSAFHDVTSINSLVFDSRGGAALAIGARAFALGNDASTGTANSIAASNAGFSGALILPENVTFMNSSNPPGSGSGNSYAFQFRSAFTSLEIGNGCSAIPGYAFAYCSGLTEVTLPANVGRLITWAFRRCTGITTFTFGRSYPRSDFDNQGNSSDSSDSLGLSKLRPATGVTLAAGTYRWNSSTSTWDLQ
jgi:hypothetical protein